MKGILIVLPAFMVVFLMIAGCISPGPSAGLPGDADIPAESSGPVSADTTPQMIRLSFDGHEVFAELYDNPTAEDLLSMLPLTLTFRDYSGTEKISDPPRALDTTDAPAGYDPAEGDITLYAPWGNIAIFYRDFSYSQGLVPIGHITSGLNHLSAMGGGFTVTIEAAGPQERL